MTGLRVPHFTRQVELPSGELGYQLLWETASDSVIVGSPVQSWAVLEVSWSSSMRQMVPVVRRLYTRKTGQTREIYRGDRIVWINVAAPGSGPDDLDAMRRCVDLARAALPAMIAPGERSPLADKIAAIFLPADVLA